MATIGPNQPYIPPNSENVPKSPKSDKKPIKGPQQQNLQSAAKLEKILKPMQDQKQQLRASAEKIKNLPSPLMPKKDSTGSNVYPLHLEATNPHAVFKPGKSNTIKAILCSKVAKMLELHDSVPKTIEATASHVISKGDLDDEGKPIAYDKATINDQEYLINPSDCFDIRYLKPSDDEGYIVKLANNITLKLTKDGDGFVTSLERTEDEAIDESSEDDDLFASSDVEEANQVQHEEPEEEDFNPEDLNGVRVYFANDDEFLVLEQGAHLLLGDEQSQYVQRGDSRFELVEDETDETTTLIGRDVEGFVQNWVPDVVTQINGKPVDTLAPSKTREVFFNMINTDSFSDSIVLAMLFRTQDGKASDLEDTNFLFIKADDQLKLKLIDLDETWPTQNDLTDDPVLAKKGSICALQLGLMGYPQAHVQLDGAEKEHVVQLLGKIQENKNNVLLALDKYQVGDNVRSDAVKGAFNEVVDRLATFDTEKPFTLADMIFHVFPEYHKQWQALQKLGLPREEIAKWVGKASVDEVTQLRGRRK